MFIGAFYVCGVVPEGDYQRAMVWYQRTIFDYGYQFNKKILSKIFVHAKRFEKLSIKMQ